MWFLYFRIFLLINLLIVVNAKPKIVVKYFLTKGPLSSDSFEPKKWNGHSDFTAPKYFKAISSIGVVAGRKFNDGDAISRGAPESKSKPGYVDPSYFGKSFPTFAKSYLDNRKFYGAKFDPIHVSKTDANKWPSYMLNPKVHGGIFPGNIDAAADVELRTAILFNRTTNGNPPRYWEVINEPEVLFENVPWSVIIDYHKRTALKIHQRLPGVYKIGGPTKTGFIAQMDAQNFNQWNSVRNFLDMSLKTLDYFSYHWYRDMTYRPRDLANPKWTKASPSRTTAVIDLIENYAQLKTSKLFPISISEFGFNGILESDKSKPLAQRDFGYVETFNMHMVHFLKYRQVINKAAAYLTDNASWEPAAISHSLLNEDGSRRKTALAYYIWSKIGNSFKYLLVDTIHDTTEQNVVAHAFLDKNTGKTYLVAKNLANSATQVDFSVPKAYKNIKSSCVKFDKGKTNGVYTKETPSVNKIALTPYETCLYEFNTQVPYNKVPTLVERFHYGSAVVVPFKTGKARIAVQIPKTKVNSKYSILRFSLSLQDVATSPKPKSVKFNNKEIKQACKNLKYQEDVNGKTKSLWVSFECRLVGTKLTAKNNIDIQMQHKKPAYISSALVVTYNDK